MSRRIILLAIFGIVSVCLFGVAAYYYPPINERASWRVETMLSQAYYAVNPPQKAVFVPQQVQTDSQSGTQAPALDTLPEMTATDVPTATPTPLEATATSQPTFTPTLTPTPIPSSVTLNGLTHEYQQMNNCGPATLSTLLSFWGWVGDQRDTRAYLRPNYADVDDKNVDPAELADFIETQTDLKAIVRVGGDIELLKRFIAAGFPVIIEKGFQPPKEDWMGHYQVINGYDDERMRFMTQDSYIMADFPLPYEGLSERWWRDFNHVYLVAYPAAQEAEVIGILGAESDPAANYQHAAQHAQGEINRLTGRDLYFAWFNLGSNLVALGEYEPAAQAYDQAFIIYAALPEDERPWRMLWYQTGPYQAYYHTGRYQDVINLADTTLSYFRLPILEETLYWRGLAKEAIGDHEGALADLQKAIEINPTSTAAQEYLEQMIAAASG